MENLFEVHGDSLHRIIVPFQNIKWGDVVRKFIDLNVGTPLAYMGQNELHTQPCFDKSCSGESIIALVKQDTVIDKVEIKERLAHE